jgi:hypothetical protein
MQQRNTVRSKNRMTILFSSFGLIVVGLPAPLSARAATAGKIFARIAA